MAPKMCHDARELWCGLRAGLRRRSLSTVPRVCPGRGTTSSTPLPVGPDGKLYLSQGAMTNTGVIDLDAYELGWLRRLPHAHDVPSYDIVLGESNVETPDPLAGSEDARR